MRLWKLRKLNKKGTNKNKKEKERERERETDVYNAVERERYMPVCDFLGIYTRTHKQDTHFSLVIRLKGESKRLRENCSIAQ